MYKIRRTLLVVCPALAALTLGTVAAKRPASATNGELAAERAEAKAWVMAHQGRLPTSFTQLADMPMPYRERSFSGMTSKQKGDFWYDQLEAFLLPVGQLSPEQARLVAELPAPLTSEQRAIVQADRDSIRLVFDAALSLDQQRAFAQRLCARASAFFEKREAKLLFATLGPVDTAYVHLLEGQRFSATPAPGVNPSSSSRVARFINVINMSAMFPADSGTGPGCNCNIGSICQSCKNVGLGCLEYDALTICGCFNMWSCNGYWASGM
jgi:hypothetical protein